MIRSYIVLALVTCSLAACRGGKKDTAATNNSATGKRIAVKATSIVWVMEKREDADPVDTKVLIAMTDETGATDHTEVGVFAGTCSGATSPSEVVLAATCGETDTGVRLHVVHRRDELIVLRAHGHQVADELAFDIIKRIKVPIGAKIVAGSP